MTRHLLIAALRNMAANRLQTAIAIFGLSIGVTAAVLMALVIRNQTSFDHFIPGYDRTYLVVGQYPVPGRPDFYGDETPIATAAVLASNLPQIEATTRLMLPPTNVAGERLVRLKQGDVADDEKIYWADPNLLQVLPLPVFRGDAATALRQPDSIVLPRAIARKYFGREDVVGQTVAVNGHPMVVRAVIEDLPANGTSLQSGIFASDLASFSPLSTRAPRDPGSVIGYVKLKPGASLQAAEDGLPKLVRPVFARSPGKGLLLARIDSLPLLSIFHPGAKTKLLVFGATGALILLIAAINFVNLLTARAARRALEVGMRKVCGASQPSLMLQFLGEAILTVFFAVCLAVAASEWLLPPANAFLQTGAELDYGQDMPGLLLCGVLGLGLLAGAWPAFVLSSLRPSNILKGVLPQSPAAQHVRSALVVVQFSIMIGLVVASAVIYQQNRFATREGLRGDIDQMLIMRGGCNPAFRAELHKLPGVAGAVCSDAALLEGVLQAPVMSRGQKYEVFWGFPEQGFFALYGIKPLAGWLPPALPVGDSRAAALRGVVLNQSAVKRLGFAGPQAAVGRALQAHMGSRGPAQNLPIIAVVPDFSFQPLTDQPISPTIYSAGFNPLGDEDDLISIKLKGRQIPETLAAIDGLWRRTHPDLPLNRFFLNDHMQQLYLAMLREAQLLAVFSGVAIFLACLGLLGLSTAAAERRIKEIGVRKAMGATSIQIIGLLLWQFSQPVLWASLIAWPVAGLAMQRWLSGFAYHVELRSWLFVCASIAALVIALVTVSAQALIVARQKPVLALRYE